MDDIITDAEGARRSCEISGRAHYIASGRAATWNRRLGMAATAATAVVGTAIISTVESHPSVSWKITAGVVSMGAAVLSAVQTSLKLNESAASHQIAGAKYRGLARDFDLFRRTFASPEGVVWSDQGLPAVEAFRTLSERRTQLALENPTLPDRVWFVAKRESEEGGLALARLAGRRMRELMRWTIENTFRITAAAAVVVLVLLAARSVDVSVLYRYISAVDQPNKTAVAASNLPGNADRTFEAVR